MSVPAAMPYLTNGYRLRRRFNRTPYGGVEQSKTADLQNYFHDVKIINHVMKIYFHVMKIINHGMKIVLSGRSFYFRRMKAQPLAHGGLAVSA